MTEGGRPYRSRSNRLSQADHICSVETLRPCCSPTAMRHVIDEPRSRSSGSATAGSVERRSPAGLSFAASCQTTGKVGL